MPTIKYRAAHATVARVRGKASDHTCVDCGKQAQEWSYAQRKGYSENLDDYAPRCRSCHQRYDNPTCSQGHDLTDSQNVWIRSTGARVCRTCARNRQRANYPSQPKRPRKVQPPKVCEECGMTFIPQRITAKVCSNACRSQRSGRAYRARQQENRP